MRSSVWPSRDDEFHESEELFPALPLVITWASSGIVITGLEGEKRTRTSYMLRAGGGGRLCAPN